jgi:hypothetical protein
VGESARRSSIWWGAISIAHLKQVFFETIEAIGVHSVTAHWC